jgi:hypothetical protein
MFFAVPHAAISQPSQSPEQEFIYSHVRENYVRPESFALPLPNGNIVWFVANRDESGEYKVTGMAELRRSGNSGVASVPELRGAPASTIFHALADEDVTTPSFLRSRKCQSVEARPRGWAREQILQAVPPVSGGGSDQLICPENGWTWAGFVDEVKGKGYLLSFLSEGDGPESKPDHWNWPGWGSRILRGGVDDATAFYFSVLYCEEQPGDSILLGPPWVGVSRGVGTETPWPVQTSFLSQPGDQFTYQTEAGAVGEPANYRVEISGAHGIDKFYIGAAWQKPFGTLVQP